MNPVKKTKIVFSPSNLDTYDRMFMDEHNAAMGYTSPLVPRVESIVETMNRLYPVPSPIHAPFRRWIENNRLARFDCFLPPSWNCTCYKCVTYQVQSENDVVYFEQIKDEKDNREIAFETRGITTADRLPAINLTPGVENELLKTEQDIRYFEIVKDEKERNEQLEDERECQTVDRLQILCDVAARTAANDIPTLSAVRETVNVTVTHVCHFFSEIDLNGPEAPNTPKITTVQFEPAYSDQGKEKAQRDWIRRMQITPIKLQF